MPAEPCRAGDEWHWDGVRFRFLWPPAAPEAAWSGNEASCVLLVEAGDSRLLITGDVGRGVERRLVAQVPAPLDLLVAGHHGSRTSSGPQLVQSLAPAHVIFSAGRDNAFGHPHDEVVRRFRHQRSCLWNTALDGAITMHIAQQAPPQAVSVRLRPGGADEGPCHRVKSQP